MDAALVRAYLSALPDVPPDGKAVERVRFCLSTLQAPDVRYLLATVVGPGAARVAAVISAVTEAAGAPTGVLGRSLADVTIGGAPLDDAILGAAGTLSAASGYQLADTHPDLDELSRRDGTILLGMTAFAEASQRVAILVDEDARADDPSHAPRPDLVVITAPDGAAVMASLALLPDGCPCVVTSLGDDAREAVDRVATDRGIPTLIGGRDHRIEPGDGGWVFFVRDEPYVTIDPVTAMTPSEVSTGLAAALALGVMGIRMREEWLTSGMSALRERQRIAS